MAAARPPKKKLSSIIAGQQEQPRPQNYPPTNPSKPTATPAAGKKTLAKAAAGESSKPAPRARKVISVDLSMEHFRELRDIADQLGCSRTEAIRALINVAKADDDLLARLHAELDVEGVRRPSGFAARKG